MPTISEEKVSLLAMRASAERRMATIRRQRIGSLAVSAVAAFATALAWVADVDAQTFVVPLAALGLFSFAVSLTRDTSDVKAEIAALEGRLNTLEALESLKPGLKKGGNLVEQVGQAALSNVTAYFEIVMRKYRQGTMLTHSAVAISFLLVAAAVGMMFKTGTPSAAALITAGAGILTQVLTGIFFVLNKNDSEHLDKYQDKLERLTDIALMFGLVETIEDEAKADAMRLGIINRIATSRFGTEAVVRDAVVPESSAATMASGKLNGHSAGAPAP